MNCKPGELAICVEAGNRPDRVGSIVTVLRRFVGDGRAYRFSADWVIDYQGEEYVACDAFLRPLRDPGDDTRDNAWDWLPPIPELSPKLPQKEEV